MTDQVQSTPTQAAVICGHLPGRETGLAYGEMIHASGGISPIGKGPIVPVLALLIAEAIRDYLEDGS